MLQVEHFQCLISPTSGPLAALWGRSSCILPPRVGRAPILPRVGRPLPRPRKPPRSPFISWSPSILMSYKASNENTAAGYWPATQQKWPNCKSLASFQIILQTIPKNYFPTRRKWVYLILVERCFLRYFTTFKNNFFIIKRKEANLVKSAGLSVVSSFLFNAFMALDPHLPFSWWKEWWHQKFWGELEAALCYFYWYYQRWPCPGRLNKF